MFKRLKSYFHKNYAEVEIFCLIDKSSSMTSFRYDAIDGFNEFLREQKEIQDSANLTLCLFDKEWSVAIERMNLKDIPELTKKTYKLGRGTSLYDSIAKTIGYATVVVEKYQEEALPKVVVMVLTDGEDSTSSAATEKDVADFVADCSQLGWEFFFLTTSRKAFDMSASMGFAPENTHLFNNDKKGMMNSFMSMSQILKDMKVKGELSLSDEDEIIDADNETEQEE